MTYELLIEKRKIIVSALIKGINDTRDFKFILDTGATKTIINEHVAIRLGFDLNSLQKGDRLMTAGGGIHSKVMKIPKFSLFGKDFINIEASVIKFPPQIALLADGLIGMDFLLQFKQITFDFDKNVISLQ